MRGREGEGGGGRGREGGEGGGGRGREGEGGVSHQMNLDCGLRSSFRFLNVTYFVPRWWVGVGVM